MGSDTESTLAAARIQSRATVVAALLGCIGMIVAAFIGTAVGRNQGREQLRDDLEAKDAGIVQRDARIRQLSNDNAALRQRIAQLEKSGDTANNVGAADTDDAIYGGAIVGKGQEQGFTVRFYGCRRLSHDVKCYFDVTNTKAERKFQLTGYPDDARYSRAFDDHGQQHTASSTEVSGSRDAVAIPDGLTLRASIVFNTVPLSTQRFADLKFVFDYDYNLYTVDFRDIPLHSAS